MADQKFVKNSQVNCITGYLSWIIIVLMTLKINHKDFLSLEHKIFKILKCFLNTMTKGS